ncbi:MAG TPA: DUF4350 domain-containing protein [Longimicrobiaceae bacterium]|nr:DUF4350 domain-containing protein [Longimicrobiaceae bacterium]
MAKRGEKLALAAILCAVLAVGLLAGPGGRADNEYRPTTFSAGDAGTRALYLALERLGMRVEQRQTPYAGADSLPAVLAVLGPVEDASPAELAELGRRLERGGTLLFAASGGGTLLDSLGLVRESMRPDSVPRYLEDAWEGVEAKALPHPVNEGTARVRGFRYAFADSSRALGARGATVLMATRDGRPVAVELRRGRGTVIAFADVEPFTNGRLSETGVAVPFARAAARAAAGGRPVVFDEYHHGFSRGPAFTGGMRRFLAREPLGHALLQLGLVGALLLLLYGRRFGSPVPPPPVRRRSPLEHVEALAGAYRLAGARRTARHLLVSGLARRLGRRPLRDDRAGAELLERLAAHPRAAEAAGEARREWEKGRQADLVALARNVDRILAEVRRP